jgi:hypothetical protein
MSADQSEAVAAAHELERHPSLDDHFDPAIRIIEYDPAWPELVDDEFRRVSEVLGGLVVRLKTRWLDGRAGSCGQAHR